jgi:predicted small secreted protein
MRKLTKVIALLALAITSIVGLTACNTTRGAGEDIERAGEEIQDVAR